MRHRLQDAACRYRDRMPLDDQVVEADEAYQNAGEKRRAAPRPGRPAAAAGQQAPAATAPGTTTGRRSAGWWAVRAAQVRLTVERHSDGATLKRVVRRGDAGRWSAVNTDEWGGYNGLAETGRSRATVCHAAGEWARDDDGDGVREVHVNTLEGLWTGLRNFLRPFRGVSKKYLYQYVAMFEWGYNIKRVTPQFIRAMLGVPITTFRPP